ncbi:MAG TPA: response regulator [Planctomycetes bacterium]|nr:response regulator [Planctomycetota bacterium]
MRALVIDDSKTIRLILSKILKGLGYTVSEASNGQEALDRLECDGPADLALVDWNMPVMNGLEFVRAARADDANAGMCLMMVTTEVEQEQMVRALVAGANEYVTKPFTPEVIVEKLRFLGLAGEAQ